MTADEMMRIEQQDTAPKLAVLGRVHESAGARMGEYAGWNLPIDYGSSMREVSAVRNAAGLFDVSHMSRFEVTGDRALPCLQSLLTNDLDGLTDGAGLYTLMCNPDGGVIDDLIVFRRSADSYALVVNASNLGNDWRWIVGHLAPGVEIFDRTEETVLLALQGPLASDMLALAGVVECGAPRRFYLAKCRIAGVDAEVARTGYTGEDGFEISCLKDDAERLWAGLLSVGSAVGLVPCGLAARDVLRIEAGLPLYGHEIGEDISPVEAGLMRWVKLSKGPFIGSAAIAGRVERERILFGIRLEGRAVPRRGSVVRSDAGDGVVTSGTFSPTLGCGIAMAYMPCGVEAGGSAEVMGHAGSSPGRLCPLPFVKKFKQT